MVCSIMDTDVVTLVNTLPTLCNTLAAISAIPARRAASFNSSFKRIFSASSSMRRVISSPKTATPTTSLKATIGLKKYSMCCFFPSGSLFSSTWEKRSPARARS